MPFTILLIFLTSYFLHFTSRFPVLGVIRFDFVLMAILSFCILLAPRKLNTFNGSDTITKRLNFFCLFVILSIPLVQWPGSVLRYGMEFYLKVVMFYYFISKLVDTEKKLKVLVAVFIGCQIFRGLEPVYLNITQGYLPEVAYSNGGSYALNRLAGAPHDVISANPYAWVIVTTIPFIYYFGLRGKMYQKIISLLLLPPLLYGLFLSGSRTGLVILLTVILSISFLGQKKSKPVVIALICILAGGFIIASMLSPDLATRYLSIVDTSVTGGDTAHGRITGLQKGFTTVMNFYGILGHGLGSSLEVNFNYLGANQPSHDIYIELLQEVGIVGFVLFILYLKSILKSLLALKNVFTPESFMGRLILAISAWVIMDLVYSLACYGLSSWEWYIFGGLTAACVSLSEKLRYQDQRPEASPFPGINGGFNENGRAIGFD